MANVLILSLTNHISLSLSPLGMLLDCWPLVIVQMMAKLPLTFWSMQRVEDAHFFNGDLVP
jgi:hypothetical protein